MTQAIEAFVVDASVAAKWHLPDEDYSELASILLTRFAQGKTNLVAPNYIRYEVPNAITVATQGRNPRITQEQGRDAIAEFLAIPLTTFDSNDIILVAYSLVNTYGCALYDAFYLAVSEQLGIPFITADRRLFERVSCLPSVVWIGDYSPRDNGLP